MKKVLSFVTGALFNISVIAFAGTLLFQTLSQNGMIQENVLFPLLGAPTTETINTGKQPIRFKTWYTSVNDVMNGNGDVAKAAQAEGTVLLKNDNNALPLNTSTDSVSLFGVNAYDPMYSLDGAGEVKINRERQQYFYSEFEKVGLRMNESLATWYNSNQDYWRDDVIDIYGSGGSNNTNTALNGANWSDLPDAKNDSNFNTAIFVTARMTNEGIDIMPNNVSGMGAYNNDYLQFTENEISVLEGLKERKDNGDLDKIIVIFNQANPVMEDLPEELDKYGVDAALWIGTPGSDGIAAVADILVGTTSPSGGLSDTWFTARDNHPSTASYGQSTNVIIQEDVYLGYKYSESRYYDYVTGQGNAGNWIYGDNISYPFGYGLSYADFSYELVSVEANQDPSKNYDKVGNLKPAEDRRYVGEDYADDLLVTVNVTNNSQTVSGKGIVQLYVNKPYTETDKEHGVESPAVELVGYGKTRKLAPGESDTVTIEVDANKLFASYDKTVKTYTLEAGNYYLAAARNAHEAMNSILLQQASEGNGVTVDRNKMDSEYGEGDADLVDTIVVNSNDSSNYEYDTWGGAKVTNLFDASDPNIASGNPNKVKFMSRENWVDTADNGKDQISAAQNSSWANEGDMNVNDIFNGNSGFTTENGRQNVETYLPEVLERYPDEYPNYGLHRNGNVVEVQLSEMIGVEYDPEYGATEEDIEKWDYFLDQLTWEESITLVGNGLRRTINIDSIGKPYTNDVNASNAISWKFDMSNDGSGTSNVGFAYHFDAGNRNHYPTGYPCEGIIASSFNNEIAYAVGQAIGEDGLWTGASGLYGFGLGLHRNPYHGRAGEYYSEDPFLTGMIGGYSSKGAQSKGLYVYNKHFVLNDQETNRTGYKTWLTEQCMRETYLRPFEIAIEIGDAMNVMNSFNKIGSAWSGGIYNLMTACLRDEFGMRGFAVTDYWQSGGMNIRFGMLAGTDLPDGTGAQSQIRDFGPDNGDFGFYAQAVRQACQRILYTVANSNAMNFIGEGTQIITHNPAWMGMVDQICSSVSITFYVITGIYVACYAALKIVDDMQKHKLEIEE